MATELGKAYVQIMPSAKGISGSIQSTINPEATAAGKSAGRNIASAMADSIGKAGSTLTKSLTVPALGAATAISSIVGVLGWGRLTGLDSARAKLQGLGYDAQAVERISGQVSEAIQGTVTTMAEGVSVAAGGLAAGIEEGAELERYIKLVGDAAVGANRPVNDMASIFNRVQGMGKLMTQELNMIEDGMPGFAMAMAESLGVTQEEFRKMVTDGKVSSEQFLDVMENFAGSMSDAYANSWTGMVKNTLSNIGIIGENILGGVFQQSKESIAEFLTFLRSDDLRSWAVETGQVIGDAFSQLVENVKNAIQWWINLDTNTKNLFITLAGIAIAIGPVLLVVGKLITTISTLVQGFGLVKGAIGIVTGALSAISAPVLIVVGVIAGLIALFVRLYQTNETFRESVQNIWTSIQETISNVFQVIMETISVAIQAITDFVMEVFGGLVEWWNENSEMILQATMNVWDAITATISTVMDVIWSIMQALWPVIRDIIVSTWEAIKGTIEGAIKVITGIIEFFAALFTGNWSAMWDAVKQILSGAVQFLINFIQVSLVGRALRIGRSLLTGFTRIMGNLWNRVKRIFQDGINSAYRAVTGMYTRFKNAGKKIVTSIADGIKGAISFVTDAIGSVADKIRGFLPFSPAKEGPLKDLDKLNFGGTISMGINDGADEVQRAMDRMLTAPMRTATPYNNAALENRDIDYEQLGQTMAKYLNFEFNIDGEKVATAVNQSNAVNAMIGGYMG